MFGYSEPTHPQWQSMPGRSNTAPIGMVYVALPTRDTGIHAGLRKLLTYIFALTTLTETAGSISPISGCELSSVTIPPYLPVHAEPVFPGP